MKTMMLSKYAYAIGLSMVSLCSTAQTVLKVGNELIDKATIVTAYQKNNQGPVTDTALLNYAQLYARYRQKLQAAYALRLDTLSTLQDEMTNLRNQLAQQFMNDESSVKVLSEEAWKRSLYDRKVAHIYLPFTNANRAAVMELTEKISREFKKGVSFEQLAKQYSKDSLTANKGGYLGRFSVFSLPYVFENAVYLTPVKQMSEWITSSTAFHAFYIMEEQPAAGSLQVAQILLAYPPNPSAALKKSYGKRADSLYAALHKGAAFEPLVSKFSDDPETNKTGGVIAPFTPGKFDPYFEQQAFSLNQNLIYSKPIETRYGWHLLKWMGLTPPIKDSLTGVIAARERVLNDARVNQTRTVLVERVKQQSGFRRLSFAANQLQAWVDSTLKTGPGLTIAAINAATPLYTIGKETVTANDLATFVRQQFSYVSPLPDINMLLAAFEQDVVMQHYMNNLELYNQQFAGQLKEFSEGNLLFEVMQREVWNKAATDTAGLRRYYAAHAQKYWWEPSAAAILITCTNSKEAEQLQGQLKKNPKQWRKLVDAYQGSVLADSGRYELGQIPVLERTNFQPGLITAPVTNEVDQSVTFAYIVKVFREREPRSFEDAKGFVASDYQQVVEQQWLVELDKEYPIQLNEKELIKQ